MRQSESVDPAFSGFAIFELEKVFKTGEFPQLLNWLIATGQGWKQENYADERYVKIVWPAMLPQLSSPYEVVRLQLRDCRDDGTNASKRTKFSRGRNYRPSENRLRQDQKAAELSIYALDPREPLADELEFFLFQQNPFAILHQFETLEGIKAWINKFQIILERDHIVYPGNYCKTGIKKASSGMLAESAHFLYSQGYTDMRAVPTWWHTWQSFKKRGFVVTHTKDADVIALLEERLKDFLPSNLQESSHPQEKHRAYAQLSWIVMLQFAVELAEHLGFGKKIVDKLFEPVSAFVIRDAQDKVIVYPLSLTHNLWIEYPLTEESVAKLRENAAVKNQS